MAVSEAAVSAAAAEPALARNLPDSLHALAAFGIQQSGEVGSALVARAQVTVELRLLDGGYVCSRGVPLLVHIVDGSPTGTVRKPVSSANRARGHARRFAGLPGCVSALIFLASTPAGSAIEREKDP